MQLFYTIEAPRSDAFFKETLIRSLLVSHQGWNISSLFIAAHLHEVYRLAIHISSEMGFLSLCCQLPAKNGSPAWSTTCPETIMERFGFPDQHLLLHRCYLNAYKGLHKDIRSLQPLTLTRPHTGKNWSTQPHTHGFFWPGLHQPVPDPVLPQPDSSQVALSHHALSPGLCLHHRLHIKPYLAPHCSPKTPFAFFQFFLQLFSNLDCHIPFFLPGCYFSLKPKQLPTEPRKLRYPYMPLPISIPEHGSTSTSNLYRHCFQSNTCLQTTCGSLKVVTLLHFS